MNDASTMKKTAKPSKHDWKRFDAMTARQRHAAAGKDADAQALRPDDMKRMKRTPQVKIIRSALGMSQEYFPALFHIPLRTLRDCEQSRKVPDAPARAYLMVIARNPTAVSEALH